MGIIDILNGMMNGPRGPKSPQPSGQGGGISPITLALLALLAYKAYQGGMFGGGKDAPQTSPFPPLPGGKGETTAGTGGGGIGDLIGDMLGGNKSAQAGGGGLGGLLGPILAGGAAGSILSGGLGELLKQMTQHGQGKVADSWIGTGQNQQIAPRELENTLGSDIIDALVRQTGESKNDVLADLSRNLPDLVDMLSPGGKMPTEKDIQRFL